MRIRRAYGARPIAPRRGSSSREVVQRPAHPRAARCDRRHRQLRRRPSGSVGRADPRLHRGPRPTDAVGIALLVAAVVLVALALAAAGSLLTDWNFELKDEGDRLVAQRGLLTRRAVAIDRGRVRGLDLLDSPLRRPFGLVGVRAIAGEIQGGRAGRAALAPVIAQAEARARGALDPQIDPDAPLEPHPRAARTRRYVRALAAPVALVPVVLVLQWWWAVAALLFLAVSAVPCPRPLPPARPLVRRPQAYRPQWIAPAPASSARLERGGLRIS